MSGRLASMARFDESIPEPRVIGKCASCREDIYVGEEVKRIDDGGGYVHGDSDYDCAQEYAFERVYDASGVITETGEIN